MLIELSRLSRGLSRVADMLQLLRIPRVLYSDKHISRRDDDILYTNNNVKCARAV
jgi:hypothetical protein